LVTIHPLAMLRMPTGSSRERISTFCQGPHRNRTGLKPRAFEARRLLDTNSQADRRTP
jgi:hypothetical protein